MNLAYNFLSNKTCHQIVVRILPRQDAKQKYVVRFKCEAYAFRKFCTVDWPNVPDKAIIVRTYLILLVPDMWWPKHSCAWKHPLTAPKANRLNAKVSAVLVSAYFLSLWSLFFFFFPSFLLLLPVFYSSVWRVTRRGYYRLSISLMRKTRLFAWTLCDIAKTFSLRLTARLPIRLIQASQHRLAAKTQVC